MASRFVQEPPEVVVFFKTELRQGAATEEYERTDARMFELVAGMPGFLSFKSYTGEDGERLAIVRFRSEDDLEAWRVLPEHREAQRRAREDFYGRYWVRVCRIIREYEFWREDEGVPPFGGTKT